MDSKTLLTNCLDLGIIVPNDKYDEEGQPRYSIDVDILEKHENQFGEDIYVKFAKFLTKD